MGSRDVSQTKQYSMTEEAHSRVIAVKTLKLLCHTLLVTVDFEPGGAEGCPQASSSIFADALAGLLRVP